jgi:hypothetical protein
LFVVDTAATVTELAAVANLGEVRVSRITSSSGIIAAGGPPAGPTSRAATAPFAIAISGANSRQPGVPFFPTLGNTDAERTVTVPVTREVAEVEFVNIAFLPVPLKVCKVAGSPSLLNQPFTFTVTADTAGGLLPTFSSNVTILAGPQAPAGSTQQNGFCDFVSGTVRWCSNQRIELVQRWFDGDDYGSRNHWCNRNWYYIADRRSNCKLRYETAVITQLINNVNEVQFVNTTATGAQEGKSRKRVRFF